MIFAEIAQSDLREPGAPIRASIEDDPLRELAESIREVGLLQPLLVAKRGEKYEVIAGHRRLLATRMLGMVTVPCCVVDSDDDTTVLAGRVHENLVRRDITVVEEAVFYAELMEKFADVDKVCQVTHRSRGVVESRLLLLSGDRAVLHATAEGQIPLAVALELNREKNDGKRAWFLEHAVKDGASSGSVNKWRRDYADLSFDQVNSSAPPEAVPGGEVVQPAGQVCYLCGSAADQADIRWVPMHDSCRRVNDRNRAIAAGQEQ